MNRITTLSLFAALVSLGLFVTEVEAQRRGGNRNDRIIEYLKRLDRNGNEILEVDEMSGSAGRFLGSQGFDVSQPLSLSRATKKFKNADKNDGKKEKSGESEIVRKVPGFGVESESASVMGFGADGEPEKVIDYEAKYGNRVMELVERTLQGYDKNKNGVLDPDEVKKARWGKPAPEESDRNRDGVLSKMELAERYLARDRDSGRSRSSRGSSSSSSSRSSRSSSSNSKPSSGTTRSSSKSAISSRVSSSSSRSRSRGSTPATPSANFNSGSDRYKRYAQGLMTQYDANKDGKLDKAELGKMRRPPKNADANGDGVVTADELTNVLSGNSRPSTTVTKATTDKAREATSKRLTEYRSNSRSGSSSSSRTRSRSRRSSSMAELDKNQDGQIQMGEFAEEWDGEILAEFEAKDTNDDGVITAEEWNGR